MVEVSRRGCCLAMDSIRKSSILKGKIGQHAVSISPSFAWDGSGGLMDEGLGDEIGC